MKAATPFERNREVSRAISRRAKVLHLRPCATHKARRAALTALFNGKSAGMAVCAGWKLAELLARDERNVIGNREPDRPKRLLALLRERLLLSQARSECRA